MALHNLPSRDDFIANHVTVIDSCNICFEPFNTEHIPARLSGVDSCHHVFGSACLKRWLTSANDNANTCPTCRTRLYHLDEDSDDDDAGDYDNQQYSANNANHTQPIALYHQSQQTGQDQQNNIIVTSLQDVSDLNTAYSLMQFISDCFDEPEDYSDEHIRSCVEEVLQKMAQQEDILITVEEWLWSRIINAIRKLLDEWSATTLCEYPPPLRRVQIMAYEVHWDFDEDFDYGDLYNEHDLAALYFRNGQDLFDLRLHSDSDFARWLVRSLNYWAFEKTSPLTHRMDDARLRQLAQNWFSKEMGFTFQEHEWAPLLEFLHKLRWGLTQGRGRIEVELTVDLWVEALGRVMDWPSLGGIAQGNAIIRIEGTQSQAEPLVVQNTCQHEAIDEFTTLMRPWTMSREMAFGMENGSFDGRKNSAVGSKYDSEESSEEQDMDEDEDEDGSQCLRCTLQSGDRGAAFFIA